MISKQNNEIILPKLKGPVVLQVKGIKNVAVPPSKEDFGGGGRLLALVLSDGHSTIRAFEFKTIPGLR